MLQTLIPLKGWCNLEPSESQGLTCLSSWHGALAGVDFSDGSVWKKWERLCLSRGLSLSCWHIFCVGGDVSGRLGRGMLQAVLGGFSLVPLALEGRAVAPHPCSGGGDPLVETAQCCLDHLGAPWGYGASDSAGTTTLDWVRSPVWALAWQSGQGMSVCLSWGCFQQLFL